MKLRVEGEAECGRDHKLFIAEIKFPFTKTRRELLLLLQNDLSRNLYQRRPTLKLDKFRYKNIYETHETVKIQIRETALEAMGKEATTLQKYNFNITEKINIYLYVEDKKKMYTKYQKPYNDIEHNTNK